MKCSICKNDFDPRQITIIEGTAYCERCLIEYLNNPDSFQPSTRLQCILKTSCPRCEG